MAARVNVTKLSFPRRRESSFEQAVSDLSASRVIQTWIPACAGMTPGFVIPETRKRYPGSISPPAPWTPDQVRGDKSADVSRVRP